MQLFPGAGMACLCSFGFKSFEIKALPPSPAGISGVSKEKLYAQQLLVAHERCWMSWGCSWAMAGEDSHHPPAQELPSKGFWWCWAACVFFAAPGVYLGTFLRCFGES